MECELNVDIVVSKLSMYSSYSSNLGRRRRKEPTVPVVFTTECASMRDCILMVLAREGSMACELRIGWLNLS